MNEMIIRKGMEQDVDAIAVIEAECFTTPWSRDSILRDITGNDKALYIVADMDGLIVGYMSVWNICDEGNINNIAVLPEYRRNHIASILMESMIRVTEGFGIKSHTLEVRRSNTAAIKLYEKFGFREAGVRPGYYEDDGEDALIMWRIGDPNIITGES